MIQFDDFFINIVDECIENTQNKEIFNIKHRHGIKNNNITTEFQIKGLLYELLKERFKEPGDLDVNHIYKLCNQLALEHLIFGKEINPYFNVLSLIRAYTNSETTFPAIDNAKKWESLITLVLDYLYLSREDWTEGYITNKLKLESKAAKFWIERGYHIGVSNGKINLEVETYYNMSFEVEKKLIELGGHNVLNALLKKVPYDEKILRYRLIRDETSLAIPFGYLINLCVKNFNKLNHPSEKLFQQNLDELFSMATNLVALLQLQEFNKYSHLLVSEHNFIQYLYNNILIDKIIKFRQYNPLFVPIIIKGMLKDLYIEYNFEEKLGINIDILIEIINFLLNSSQHTSGFRVFKLVDLEKKFPVVPKGILVKVLDIFSHNYKKINNKFRVPNDISDYELKPLIKKKDKYILVDRTLNSISFYEALCQFMRTYIANFNEIQGNILENFIKAELDKRNIVHYSGYYNRNEECDLIIETKKYIFIIEIKRKPLTRKALSGDDVQIFSDIAKSILASQFQLGKREIELLKKGKIVLYSKKGKRNNNNKLIHIVYHKNRIIERVSLNAWDYGVMNDNIFSQTLLKFLTGVKLTTKQEHQQDLLDEVSEISMKLHEQFEEIQKYSKNETKNDYRKLYFDCSFISLQMLLTRINNIKGNQEFEESMETLKYVTSGLGDPYFEFDYFKELKNK